MHEDACMGDACAFGLGLLRHLKMLRSNHLPFSFSQFSSPSSSISSSLTQDQKLYLSFEFSPEFSPSQCWDFSDLKLHFFPTRIVSWCLLADLKGLYISSAGTPACCKTYQLLLCSLGFHCNAAQDLTLILPVGHFYWAGWQEPLGEMAPSYPDSNKHTHLFLCSMGCWPWKLTLCTEGHGACPSTGMSSCPFIMSSHTDSCSFFSSSSFFF